MAEVDLIPFTASDGTELVYRDFGARHGPTLMLCHGLGAGGRQFASDAAYFAGLGYRVLVPDLRGHGASSVPSGYPLAGFATARLASDMIELLDHAGVGRVHWVGNSLGGIIALDLLGSHPQRLASLAMFGTAFALALPSAVSPLVTGLYRAFGAGLVSRVAAFNTTKNPGARPLIAQMLREFDPRAGRAIAAHVRRYDLTAHALAYAGPLLVLVGGRDAGVNLALRPQLRRVGARAGWGVVEIAQGGHCANLDATDAVRDALLAFWDSQATSARSVI